MKSVSFLVYGDPVPFARAGSFGKRRFTPAKQRDYMLAARQVAHEAMKDSQPFEGPLSMRIVAVYLHPASWSMKRKRTTFWKPSRPDADNLAKAIMDCIGINDSLASIDKLPPAIVYFDDAQIVKLSVEKHYGAKAYVSVHVAQGQNLGIG